MKSYSHIPGQEDLIFQEISSAQLDLQIQCNPNQNSRSYLQIDLFYSLWRGKESRRINIMLKKIWRTGHTHCRTYCRDITVKQSQQSRHCDNGERLGKQFSGTEQRAQIDSYKCKQLTFDKGAKAMQLSKDSLLN